MEDLKTTIKSYRSGFCNPFVWRYKELSNNFETYRNLIFPPELNNPYHPINNWYVRAFIASNLPMENCRLITYDESANGYLLDSKSHKVMIFINFESGDIRVVRTKKVDTDRYKDSSSFLLKTFDKKGLLRFQWIPYAKSEYITNHPIFRGAFVIVRLMYAAGELQFTEL